MAKRRKVKKTAIAYDDASDRLSKAAAAAGLSIEELADLIVDAGICAIPPSEGVTDNYSIDDVGMRLWVSASGLSRSRREKWFHGLLDVQKASVICSLRERGFAIEAISSEFGLDRSEVLRTWNSYADKMGEQVVGLRLNTIAGQMQIVKERAQQLAMDSGNAKAYWAIEREFIGKLQDLGIVDRAIHRVEHTHKFGDEARSEIEAVLDLERKKVAAVEEMKQITAEVFDAAPLTGDDDED